MASSSSRNPSLSFDPWTTFFIFLVSNILLSYFSFSGPVRWGIAFLGLVCPLGLALKNYRPAFPSGPPLHAREFLPRLSWVLLAAVLALAVAARFYRLTTLSAWPHYDEGADNFIAFKLAQHWDWSLFVGYDQSTPVFFWMMGMVYEFFRPSLAVLWAVPALISLLTVPVGYLAARQFFSRSFSLVLTSLLALSFWPLFTGRFSFIVPLVLWMECLLFYLWGRWEKSADARDRGKRLVLFGIGLGAFFYVCVPHALVFCSLIGWTLLDRFRRSGPGRFKSFWKFLLPFFLLALPLAAAALRQGYGHYLGDLWSSPSDHSIGRQTAIAFSYLHSLFWGRIPGATFNAYQSVWGGFLNPILGSLFLLGAVEVARNLAVPLYRWLALAFFYFFLPGALSQTFEPFRLLSILSVLLVVAALGFARLSLRPPAPRMTRGALLLLAAAFALDLYQLAVPYPRVWNDPENWKINLKSIERYRAYVELKKIAAKEGPGLVLSDFVPGNGDQSLSLADDPFNASQNPRLPFESARWAGLLTNVHYQPFLKKRFPDGKAYYLSRGLSPVNGGWMLWVIPSLEGRERQAALRRWNKACRSQQASIENYLAYVHGKPSFPIRVSLERTYPLFQGDPFLESCYGEKLADHFLKFGAGNHGEAIAALKTSLKKGYPAAHLYHLLGTLYWIDRDQVQARRAFQQAVEAPLDFTNSRQYLAGGPR